MLAYSAYCEAPYLKLWNCYWCNTTNVQVNHVFYNNKTNIYGYTGIFENKILVAFRGTQIKSLRNWINNLRICKTIAHPQIPESRIHKGFLENYQSVRNEVLAQVRKLRQYFPTYPILLTGHSLGAALADLCSVDLHFLHYKNLEIFHFGSPRVGNNAFQEFVKENMKNRITVVNQKDIVTGLPLEVMGFKHIPQEIWFQNNTKEFKVCDCCKLDPTCSNQMRFRLSVFNHLTYLGHDRRHSKPYNCP